jgi:alpha-amylase
MPRPILLLMLVAVALAGCTAPGAQAPASSATPTSPPGPTSTVNPLLPTAPIPITPAPTAAPFPLEAGWWDGAVCYQVFVRSFYDSDGDGIGDLQGLIQKLDYVNDGDPASRSDLGANCIWLMPIMTAASYHGYDTIDYYTVDPAYGTNDDFKQLVAEAEARGIKVIIDLVLNHTSTQHPWFQEALRDPASSYRDWYLWAEARPRYQGPWGQRVWHSSPLAAEYYYGIFWSEMPDLNYRNPEVTAEAYRISAFWLNEMGAAGFRMDAIRHLIELQAAQADTLETFAWLREYRQFLQAVAPEAFTIGEIFGADPATLAPYYPDQLDHYFAFNLGEGIRIATNSGTASRYLAEVSATYNRLPYQRWAPFLTNHDQKRIMSELGNDPVKARLAALALLSLPGMPFVYYGEELGMLGVKPDENLRTPMHWTREEFGGFTAGYPWRAPQPDYPVKNVMAQDADPDSLLNSYRELIHLHVQTPALATGDYLPLTADDPGVAAFLRMAGDEAALVLINFSPEAATLNLSLAQSPLTPGEYRLTTLFGAPPGALAPLRVDAGGAITAQAPLNEMPAQSGFILRLTP